MANSTFSSSNTSLSDSNSSNFADATGDFTARVSVVLFDYGQVLSGPPNPSAWATLRAVSGLDEARLHTAYWEFRHAYDSGALTGVEYWRAVASHAGVEFDVAQMLGLMAADIDVWTKLNQPMVDWAARLQCAGIRTGVLSNIGDCIGEGIVARLPWLANFDHCTWSYELKLAKPDPEIYRKTAEALNAAPEEILFIDDREENIAAAAALGFQTLHYTGQEALNHEMRARGLAWLLEVGLDSKGTDGEGVNNLSIPAFAR
jgi:putative hydrolase of the HAD superfamily